MAVISPQRNFCGTHLREDNSAIVLFERLRAYIYVVVSIYIISSPLLRAGQALAIVGKFPGVGQKFYESSRRGDGVFDTLHLFSRYLTS